MKIIKVYKYLIKPDKQQKQAIQKIFGKITIVHNQYVQDKKEGKNLNRLAKEILKEYKEKYPELSDTDSSALMNELFKLNDKKDDEMNFTKKRHSYTTSCLKYGESFYVSFRTIHLPRVGDVNILYHRPIPKECRVLNATIIEDKTGTYYACIALETYSKNCNRVIDLDKSIGLDYSSPNFYVDSKGRRANMPAFYRKQEERISEIRRKLSKQIPGSESYYKVKNKLDKVSKKIRNQRNDWLHKETSRLIKEYDLICLESLEMKDIAKFNRLSKATYDNSYGLFQKMLEYKAKENNKRIVHVSKWFPSSKLCSECGKVNMKLQLDNREWVCPYCGCLLDRDVNAAKNIEREGKRIIIANG